MCLLLKQSLRIIESESLRFPILHIVEVHAIHLLEKLLKTVYQDSLAVSRQRKLVSIDQIRVCQVQFHILRVSFSPFRLAYSPILAD